MAISTVGSSGRDYVDLAAWVADLPATLTEQEVAEMYNDSEFTSASEIAITGITTTASNNLIIRPATGQGFNDTEQALRYNAANGVAVRKTTGYGSVISVNVDNILIEDIQFSTGSGILNTAAFVVGTGSTGTNVNFRNCIFESSSAVRGATVFRDVSLVNCVLVVTRDLTGIEGLMASYAAVNLYNCTFASLATSSTAFGVEKVGNAANNSVVKNSAFFGFGTALEGGTWGAGTDYNGTDDTTLPAGSNNQTSLVYADQFENITAGTLDLRLKSGNSLDGNGTPDSANTNDLDIFGNARSLTTPSIGAYETPAAGGITVTEQLKNINYTSNNPVITLTGTISVTEQLKNISYNTLNPTITLTSSIQVTEQTKNINYSSLNPSITLTGVISITEQTKNIQYTSNNPTIDLTGVVSIVEQTSNYNVSSNNPTITLTPKPITIIEQTRNIQYQALNPSILLTPEPIGIVSTVCFPGCIKELSFNGVLIDLAFNGDVKNVELNGNLKDLEFNGTIKQNCTNGNIKTDC